MFNGGRESTGRGLAIFREGEVTTMSARAPTCVTCGTILTGFEWSDELEYFVHFCPACREQEKPHRREVELKKAA
jgi:hypothetical protein